MNRYLHGALVFASIILGMWLLMILPPVILPDDSVSALNITIRIFAAFGVGVSIAFIAVYPWVRWRKRKLRSLFKELKEAIEEDDK